MRALWLALLLATGLSAAQAAEWVGSAAPAISLPDQTGKQRELSSLRGKWVALYFYPKNNTPGCTEEARQFSAHYPQLKANNVEVVGVSVDDVDSHREFAKKLGLPFILLADTAGAVAKQFGVLKGLGPVKFAARETFLIDPEGTIVYHYGEVDSREHAAQVLRDVQRLSAAEKPGK